MQVDTDEASDDVRRRSVEIVVDDDALRHNLGVARARSPSSKVFAVIKADAYGHGALGTARALGGDAGGPVGGAVADGFAVVTLHEAIALREGGIVRPILVMQGPRPDDDLEAFRRHGLWPAIHAREQLDRLLAERPEPPAGALQAWLKVDTGMGRLGFLPAATGEPLACDAVRWIGVMSHLACADEPGNAHARAQMKTFRELAVPASLARSLGNSAALLGWPDCGFEWVRPGLMLYGVDPLWRAAGPTGGTAPDPAAVAVAADAVLRPAMSVTAPLISVKRLPRGAGVGYAQTWRCPEDMLVGHAAVGYADGLPRVLSRAADVLVHGTRCAIVGRVSMDSVAIDLRHAPQARVGDRVTLFGPGQPVERLAAAAGTIGYELLTGIRGHRRRRSDGSHGTPPPNVSTRDSCSRKVQERR